MSEAEFPLHRGKRYSDGLGGLLEGQAPKISMLHDLPLTGVHRFQPLQRFVECCQGFGLRL
jgi:hypothetical protein